MSFSIIPSIRELSEKHSNETCWIIGKGPSLQYLKKDQIKDGIVIAINESIISIQNMGLENITYSMQKDFCGEIKKELNWIKPDQKLHNCQPNKIKPINNIPVLLHEHESKYCLSDYSPKYIFDNEKDFNILWYEFSSLTAIYIAKLMGCNKFNFVSHDSCINRDTITYVKDSPLTDSPQYLIQANKLLRFITINNLNHEFIIPYETK